MDKQQTQLFEAAKAVLSNAYAPYSHYQVGASIVSDSGKIYTGTNIENVSYGLTICAETAAISQMVSNGETRIKALLVMANHDTMCTPCGGCRQRIAEFTDGNALIHLCNFEKIMEVTTLSTLLPYTFENNNIKR
tara:strand:+ start:444 stop:848 length:405 start_codon:yes stop_codon:yes gene_type:complete